MSAQWVKIAEFSLSDNLTGLNQRLSALNISHRFTEERGGQYLWVSSEHNIQEVHAIIRDCLERGTVANPPAPQATLLPILDVSSILKYPLTVVWLLLGTAGFLVIFFKLSGIAEFIRFMPIDWIVANTEYWRIVTPAFFHFDIMHLVFNGLWIWFVGKRLEAFMGWKAYLLLFVVSAAFSNVLQYAFVREINFGGLSGVVYAFFGCIFVLYKRHPVDELAMPSGMFVFMLVWLALGFSGIIDNFIQGQIANWAHLGGLLAGLAFGLSYSFLVKKNDEYQ